MTRSTTTIGPYVRFIASMLRFVVPVARAAYATTLSKDELDLVKTDIELTETLADRLPQSQGESTTSLPQGMTRAEGAGLRSLLLALDPVSAFGDLRRAYTPSGDVRMDDRACVIVSLWGTSRLRRRDQDSPPAEQSRVMRPALPDIVKPVGWCRAL